MLKKTEKNNKIKILGIGLFCLFLLGCSNESLLIEQEEADISSDLLEAEQIWEEISETVQEEGNEATGDTAKQGKEKVEIAVHICGAVNQPGVYLFQSQSRIYEGIQKAGGFTKEAAKDYLNLALPLEDGMKIEVPTEDMLAEWMEEDSGRVLGISYDGKEESISYKEKDEGKVNLNTADETLLCTLPGIGESRAKSIIAYRDEYGAFQKIEDIMKIPGIKEAAFEKIKEYVIVSK